MAHPNEDLLRQGYDAFANGDLERLDQLFADDIVWHSGGNTPLSGVFEGKEAVFGNFAKIPEMTDDFSQELHAILADDEHAVALVKSHVERDGRSLDGDGVHVFHFNDGQVTEAWIIAVDQEAQNAFWAD